MVLFVNEELISFMKSKILEIAVRTHADVHLWKNRSLINVSPCNTQLLRPCTWRYLYIFLKSIGVSLIWGLVHRFQKRPRLSSIFCCESCTLKLSYVIADYFAKCSYFYIIFLYFWNPWQGLLLPRIKNVPAHSFFSNFWSAKYFLNLNHI